MIVERGPWVIAWRDQGHARQPGNVRQPAAVGRVRAVADNEHFAARRECGHDEHPGAGNVGGDKCRLGPGQLAQQPFDRHGQVAAGVFPIVGTPVTAGGSDHFRDRLLSQRGRAQAGVQNGPGGVNGGQRQREKAIPSGSCRVRFGPIPEMGLVGLFPLGNPVDNPLRQLAEVWQRSVGSRGLKLLADLVEHGPDGRNDGVTMDPLGQRPQGRALQQVMDGGKSSQRVRNHD